MTPLFGRMVCSERFPQLFSDPDQSVSAARWIMILRRNAKRRHPQSDFPVRWKQRSVSMAFAVRLGRLSRRIPKLMWSAWAVGWAMLSEHAVSGRLPG